MAIMQLQCILLFYIPYIILQIKSCLDQISYTQSINEAKRTCTRIC